MKIERLVIIPDYKEEFKSWHPGPTVKAMEMKDLCKYSYQAYFYLTYYTPIENPEERLASSKPFFFMTNTYLKKELHKITDYCLKLVISTSTPIWKLFQCGLIKLQHPCPIKSVAFGIIIHDHEVKIDTLDASDSFRRDQYAREQQLYISTVPSSGLSEVNNNSGVSVVDLQGQIIRDPNYVWNDERILKNIQHLIAQRHVSSKKKKTTIMTDILFFENLSKLYSFSTVVQTLFGDSVKLPSLGDKLHFRLRLLRQTNITELIFWTCFACYKQYKSVCITHGKLYRQYISFPSCSFSTNPFDTLDLEWQAKLKDKIMHLEQCEHLYESISFYYRAGRQIEFIF